MKVFRNFNVVVLRDHVQCGGAAEGRVLVGRNAIYQGYQIGKELLPSSQRADLIVKEKMYIEQGINYAGNSVLGNKQGNLCYSMLHGNGREGQPLFSGRKTLLDMPFLQRQAEKMSRALFALEDNGTSYTLYDTITFLGVNPFYNIFSYDFSEPMKKKKCADGIKSINFVVPGRSTLVINMKGEQVCLPHCRFYWNGVPLSKCQVSHIFWNCGEGQIVLGNEMKMQGSLLAPQACFWACSAFCGTVLVKDLIGCLEAQLPTFQGELPLCLRKEQE